MLHILYLSYVLLIGPKRLSRSNRFCGPYRITRFAGKRPQLLHLLIELFKILAVFPPCVMTMSKSACAAKRTEHSIEYFNLDSLITRGRLLSGAVFRAAIMGEGCSKALESCLQTLHYTVLSTSSSRDSREHADLSIFETFVIMKYAKELLFQDTTREFPFGRGKNELLVCCF